MDGETWNIRLKRRRRELGLTQTVLAEKVGVEQTTMAGWEAGRRYPERADTFERLAEALVCHAAWLRYGIDVTDTAAIELHRKLQSLSDGDRSAVLSLIDSLSRQSA